MGLPLPKSEYALVEGAATASIAQRSSDGLTRWATHGIVNRNNAHPFSDENLTLVCNGIIENYLKIQSKSQEIRFKFVKDGFLRQAFRFI